MMQCVQMLNQLACLRIGTVSGKFGTPVLSRGQLVDMHTQQLTLPLGLNTAICPEHIEAIKVDTYEDAKKFCDCKQPATSQQAKFSIQHAVAICFIKGPPKLEYFETEDLEDPVIAQLRNVISINVGKEFENAYPAHFGASVTVYF